MGREGLGCWASTSRSGPTGFEQKEKIMVRGNEGAEMFKAMQTIGKRGNGREIHFLEHDHPCALMVSEFRDWRL